MDGKVHASGCTPNREPEVNSSNGASPLSGEASQGSNDRGSALAEKKSESEASKGQLSGQTESVEVAGNNMERVREEKKEVLTQGEESLHQ